MLPKPAGAFEDATRLPLLSGIKGCGTGMRDRDAAGGASDHRAPATLLILEQKNNLNNK